MRDQWRHWHVLRFGAGLLAPVLVVLAILPADLPTELPFGRGAP
jgi:hypothetical protein